MFGEWLLAFCVLLLLFGALWLLGTLQTLAPARANSSLVGVLILLAVCILSAREILGQFVDLGSFRS